MYRKKILIAIVILSTLFLTLTFSQINKKDKVFANIFNYESLAHYVKSQKSLTSQKTSNLIDESKYAEQYYFKKHLTSANLTDSEAKKEAFEQVLEETVLFEKATSEKLLGTKEEALRMSNEVRNFLKNETEENKEVVQSVNEIIKGLDITEDQYFNEFLIDRYITTISIEKLYEKVTDDYEEEVKNTVWEEFKQKEVNKFITKNQESINEFKSTYGIK